MISTLDDPKFEVRFAFLAIELLECFLLSSLSARFFISCFAEPVTSVEWFMARSSLAIRMTTATVEVYESSLFKKYTELLEFLCESFETR